MIMNDSEKKCIPIKHAMNIKGIKIYKRSLLVREQMFLRNNLKSIFLKAHQ